jgi:hypothetical protein
MRSTSSKPPVVIRPVFAPFRSMMVLIPMVLPWIAEDISSADVSPVSVVAVLL